MLNPVRRTERDFVRFEGTDWPATVTDESGLRLVFVLARWHLPVKILDIKAGILYRSITERTLASGWFWKRGLSRSA